MKEKYWYYTESYYCPVCGYSEVIKKERRYTDKPIDYNERNVEIIYYDYCD